MANLSNINNKFLVTTTGEVLIGQTSNNGNRLQITGADGASYIYLKTDVATTGGRIGFNGDALRVFNQQASGELNLGTAGTTRLTIDSSGNLLLNQASSRIKGGGSTTGRIELSNSDSKSYMMITGSTRPSAQNLIYFVNDAAVTLTLNADNTSTFAGNVGIGTGTDSPEATLELYNISATSDGDGSSTETLSGQDSLLLRAAGGGGVGTTTGSITWRAGNRRRAMITSVQENADGDYQGISFYTQGTDGSGDMFESMRIAHSGNVGIGTDSPTQSKLVISGGTTGTVGGGDAGITMINKFDNPDNSWSILPVITGVSNTGFSIRDNTDSADRLVIDGSGNVGIGVTGPIYKLVVAKDGGTIASFQDTTNSNGVQFTGYSGNIDIKGYADTADTWVDLGIRSTAGAQLYLKTDGNVGIGTDSPQTKLEVNGGLVKIVENSNTAFYGGDYVRVFGTQSYGFRNSAGSAIAQISLTGNSYFNGGNVGIGTTSPNNLLNLQKDVAGGDVAAYIQNFNAATGSVDESASIKFAHGNDGVVGYVGGKLVCGKEGDFETSIANIKGNLKFYTASGTSLDSDTNNILRMRIAGNGGIFVYPGSGSYGLSMNDTNQVMNSGYSNGNQAVSLTYTCTSMSSMFIECVFNHYGYVTAYGCARVATFAVGPVITIQNILEVTSPNGGSWTFNRVSNTEFTVVKTAGTYQGGGRWFVKINGARVFAA